MKGDLETALKALPASVRARMGGKAVNYSEACVCVKVAEQVAGPFSAMLVALEVFCVPIQCDSDFTLEDVLCYVCSRFPDAASSYTESGSVDWRGRRRGRHLNANPVKLYRELTLRYFDKLKAGARLPLVDHNFGKNRFVSYSAGCWWAGHEKDTHVFPHKFGAKTIKINVRFDDLWEDVRSYYPEVAYIVASDRLILDGLYNDEACGWLIWLCAAYAIIGPAAFAVTRVFARRESSLKNINIVIKALGAQHKRWGAIMCELVSLRGRGVGRLDAWDDIKTRVDEKLFLDKKAAVCDLARLRSCVASVIKSEMARKPFWPEVDDYWSRRWLYTKSGAHSRYREVELLGRKLDLPPRPTRREFSEAVSENLVAFGEPRVDAGFSEKEEHGKTRAIYGCDTRSYFTFDYLLRPVEACWRNKRVLLDPGRKLQSLLYKELSRKPGSRYMLDFDDFNSQHTLDAMRIVIEEATVGAPAHVREWAIDSWTRMYVHWGLGDDMQEKRMVGTLPSGHRATTFINTILNAAYCMYVAEGYYENLESYHCGDDVVVFGDDAILSRFVVDFKNSNFRVNAAKQSLGDVTGEFLRVAFGKETARGYAARGIASMVSGNWITDNRLDMK